MSPAQRHQESTIRSVGLIGFPELVESMGGDAIELLNSVGIDRKVLESPNIYYSYQRYVNLFELAAEQLGEPNFGLKFALHAAPNFPIFGPVLFLARFEKNTRNWIESSLRYMKYHTSALSPEYVDDAEAGVIMANKYVDPFIDSKRQVDEMDLALTHLLARAVLGSKFGNPIAVCFRHNEPEDTSVLRQVFKCEIKFNQPLDQLIYPISILNIPIDSNWQFLKPAIDFLVNMALRREKVPENSAATKVRLLIPALFGTARCNFEDVATTLEMHPKALQRQLAEEGETFSSILEQVRNNLAKQLLQNSNESLNQIAGLLGYASLVPFSYAFKKWNNMTPGAYRKMSRAQR